MKQTPEFDQTPVSLIDLAEKRTKPNPESAAIVRLDASLLKDIDVTLEAHLGYAKISAAELMDLQSGAVVTLDAPVNGFIDLRLNHSTIARGEMVAVGEYFGIRITEISDVS
jgi:flagellar motor switch protein FliN